MGGLAKVDTYQISILQDVWILPKEIIYECSLILLNLMYNVVCSTKELLFDAINEGPFVALMGKQNMVWVMDKKNEKMFNRSLFQNK